MSNNPPSLLMRPPLKLSSILLLCIGKRSSSGEEMSVFMSIFVLKVIFVVSALNIAI
jgi:hypothetical protein